MTIRPSDTVRPRLPRLAAAVLLVATIAAGAAGVPNAEAKKGRSRTFHVSFAPDSAGGLPADAIVSDGSWSAERDSAAVSPDAAADSSAPGEGGAWRLVQSESDDPRGANGIRFTKPAFRDGEVSVRFRIRRGELDPSVGVFFLLDRKGRNGYLVRVSGADEELIAHYILNGKRRDLKFAKAPAPNPGEWHTLRAVREGVTIRVYYDGTERMSLRDERFHDGTVGLWTESDTAAEFADLEVTVR